MATRYRKGITDKTTMLAEENAFSGQTLLGEKIYRVIATKRGAFKMTFATQPGDYIAALAYGNTLRGSSAMRDYDLFLAKMGVTNIIGEFTEGGFIRTK